MPFAKINGRSVFFEVQGQGETIVLLHNGFAGLRMWGDITPRLVAAGFQVAAYDRRGFGDSEQGENFEEFYAGDRYREESVKELAGLTDYLELDNFHLIGQCEGGVVGADHAVQYPDRVKSLIMASTLCRGAVTMEEFNRLKFPKPFRDLEPEIQKKMVFWHGPERAPWLYDQFTRFGGAYGRDVFDLGPVLSRLTCPSLVLFPDRSYFFEVEQAAAAYRLLARGELAVLPKCGHNSYANHPEEYVRLAASFIKRNSLAGRLGGEGEDRI
ncbi:MAG: alpha/beta hydrolase [Pseudomonadota bacterium]